MSEIVVMGKMPVLALRGMTVFPEQTVHFDVGRVKSVKALDETKLNQVGRAGWQLCGVTQDEYGYVYYLKKKES